MIWKYLCSVSGIAAYFPAVDPSMLLLCLMSKIAEFATDIVCLHVRVAALYTSVYQKVYTIDQFLLKHLIAHFSYLVVVILVNISLFVMESAPELYERGLFMTPQPHAFPGLWIPARGIQSPGPPK